MILPDPGGITALSRVVAPATPGKVCRPGPTPEAVADRQGLK